MTYAPSCIRSSRKPKEHFGGEEDPGTQLLSVRSNQIGGEEGESHTDGLAQPEG